MQELEPTNAYSPNDNMWEEHYTDISAPEKVAFRRQVDICLEPGVEPVDLDFKLINLAYALGLHDGAAIVDIGCGISDERSLLAGFKLAGFANSLLVGVEPNISKEYGRDYWQPKGSKQEFDQLRDGGSIEQLLEYSQLRVGQERQDGTLLYKTDANFIPFPDSTFDLAVFNFSMYHVDKDKQAPALEEARRVLKTNNGEVSGILTITTSGPDNKKGACALQLEIAKELSKETNEIYSAPAPLSSGFTSDDAIELVPKHFKHVYIYEHRATTVFNTPRTKNIYMNSQRTFRDLYRTSSGAIPEPELFERTLRKVVRREMLYTFLTGRRFEDRLSRALVLASDQELTVPPDYRKVA